MADSNYITKFVIDIRSKTNKSAVQQPALHGDPLVIGSNLQDWEFELISDVKSGILEFKIEGDWICPGNVSNYPYFTLQSFTKEFI